MKILKQLPSNPIQIRVLHRPKVGGGILSVAHSGIEFMYASEVRYVLHRTPDNDTHLSSYNDFSAGQKVTSQKVATQNIPELMKRANSALNCDKSYSAVFENCEHLTSFVLYGRMESEQLKYAMIGVALGWIGTQVLFKDKPWWVKSAIIAGSGFLALNIKKTSKLADKNMILS